MSLQALSRIQTEHRSRMETFCSTKQRKPSVTDSKSIALMSNNIRIENKSASQIQPQRERKRERERERERERVCQKQASRSRSRVSQLLIFRDKFAVFLLQHGPKPFYQAAFSNVYESQKDSKYSATQPCSFHTWLHFRAKSTMRNILLG